MMSRLELHHETSKRQWDDNHGLILGSSKAPLFYPQRSHQYGGHVGPSAAARPAIPSPLHPSDRKLLALSTSSDEVANAVVPSVTVVLEGRSICHRIQLSKHESYESLAKALHHMFVDIEDDGSNGHGVEKNEEKCSVDLSNAIPGYVVAYEDMEDDLLLVGDLNWKDFVRVVKRIRIVPVKAARKKPCGNAN